jgi:ribosomal protein L35
MKAKTHSGSKKRVKITATGKFTTAKIGKRHLLQNKSTKAKGKGKYGATTHIANERKMKWGSKTIGLQTPTAKKNKVAVSADGKIIKTPRLAPKIKAVVKKVATPKVQKAPKTTAAKKAPTKKAAPKKK